MPDSAPDPMAGARLPCTGTAATGPGRGAPGGMRPGQLLARGVARHLRDLGFVSVEEFVPVRGQRLDLLALGPRGELWVIECKSSRADFTADRKWQGYPQWGDRFFWAVGPQFPREILPPGHGVILADGFGAEILRMGTQNRLAGARRRALTQRFARHAARALQALRDPSGGG